MPISQFIPYAKQSINDNDIREMGNSLKQESITRGPLVESFENALAEFCGAKYAVAFNNGTSALMAAYFAGEIGPSDRIITTPNTFIATAGSAILRGATPIFLDIERDSGNLNLEQLKFTLEKTYSRGKTCIAPVHFSGIAVNMKALNQSVANPNTIIIEDAAHALGSFYPSGEKVGSCYYSDMTIFSFHPAKTITTGEGGAVTTNSEELYRKLKLFRNNGMEKNPFFMEKTANPWVYEVQYLTGNFNLTEFQAALGLSQLSRINEFIVKRRAIVAHYRHLLKNKKGIQLFSNEYDPISAYHLFVIQIDFNNFKIEKKELIERLKNKGIGTQVHYIPLYKHPVLTKACGEIDLYFPQMEEYYKSALSLPLYADLSLAEVEKVVYSLCNILKI